MKVRSTQHTEDHYSELSPFERHVLFLESLAGKISQLRYRELLKAHFPDKEKALHSHQINNK